MFSTALDSNMLDNNTNISTIVQEQPVTLPGNTPWIIITIITGILIIIPLLPFFPVLFPPIFGPTEITKEDDDEEEEDKEKILVSVSAHNVQEDFGTILSKLPEFDPHSKFYLLLVDAVGATFRGKTPFTIEGDTNTISQLSFEGVNHVVVTMLPDDISNLILIIEQYLIDVSFKVQYLNKPATWKTVDIDELEITYLEVISLKRLIMQMYSVVIYYNPEFEILDRMPYIRLVYLNRFLDENRIKPNGEYELSNFVVVKQYFFWTWIGFKKYYP